MKKIQIAIFVLFTSFSSFAQVPVYNLWYEFDNGTFTSKTAPIPPSTLMSSILSALPPNGGIGFLGIKKITQVYPSPPPPGKLIAYNNTSSVSPTTLTAITTMPLGQILSIHTSSTDIISNDEMFMALNYLANNSNYNKLAFFYNSLSVSAPSFIPITLSGSTSTTPMESYTSTTTIPISRIRKFNGEVASIASPSLMSTIGAGYRNGLVFSITSPSTISKNIFITLKTIAGTTTGTEKLKLVFLNQGDTILGEMERPLTNNLGKPSHDPNYETVMPQCIEAATGGGTIVHYKVHFQNTGDGPALDINTKTFLPSGYTTADILGLSAIPWTIGGIRNSDPSNPYSASISSAISPFIDITFTRTTSTPLLLGVSGLADAINDPTTMGEFEFNLKLKPSLVAPLILSSHTDIYFDTNAVVKTYDAVLKIKKCCTCPDEINSDYGNNNDTHPNCKWCKRSKFIRWLFCKGC
jgi:hypothetical protein